MTPLAIEIGVPLVAILAIIGLSSERVQGWVADKIVNRDNLFRTSHLQERPTIYHDAEGDNQSNMFDESLVQSTNAVEGEETVPMYGVNREGSITTEMPFVPDGGSRKKSKKSKSKSKKSKKTKRK
jgi:hypothetical protein